MNETDLRIDGSSMIFDENNIATYVTAYTNGVPKWYKIKHNEKGAYITVNGKREYVLVSN
jgi:hypothetical protein